MGLVDRVFHSSLHSLIFKDFATYKKIISDLQGYRTDLKCQTGIHICIINHLVFI